MPLLQVMPGWLWRPDFSVQARCAYFVLELTQHAFGNHDRFQRAYKEQVAVEQSLTLQSGAEPFPGYTLNHILGRGGYAEVWQATTANGGTVALKFMHSDDPVSAAKELRAIQSMKAIRHPNLVRIDQVWSVPGHVVFSMELADGSLMDLLYAYYEEYGGPITPEHVCPYLAQAAVAIDFLNAHVHNLDGQIVAFQHGDIKPSNLLLFGDTVKLADFGLAIPMTGSRISRAPSGTVQFAATEVFQGALTDQTDQFAFAVTYCLLRGGQLPYTDSPPSFRVPYTRPAPDLTMLPEAERHVIARALSTSPSGRWPSCRAMIEALARLNNVSTSDMAFFR